MNTPKLYAIYSKQAAAIYGTIAYTTPNGGTVEVTEVSNDPDHFTSKWPDIVFLGEVVENVGKHSDPKPPAGYFSVKWK
jgi:hypothetical protein